MENPVGGISPELGSRLMRLGGSKRYSCGEVIFSEGDTADFLPIVLEGSVKLVRFPAGGKEVIIGLFRKGEIFAIPPAIDGRRFPATAVAAEDSKLLFVPRRSFAALLQESAEFNALIMRKMCGILRDRSTTVRILSTPSAEQRIGTVLLKLATDSGQPPPVEIKLRRQDIAEIAGLTTETAIRAVGSLARRGLVRVCRRKIFVDDPDRLRAVVEK